MGNLIGSGEADATSYHSSEDSHHYTHPRAEIPNAVEPLMVFVIEPEVLHRLKFASVPLIHGNKCAQVFTDGMGYDLFYSTKKDAEVADALIYITHDVGIPKDLTNDNANAQGGTSGDKGRWGKIIREF
jgi:hypothetical protein